MSARRWSSFAEDSFEGVEAALVLLWRADGDADPFGELVAAHRPDDDADFLEFGEHALAFAYADENEVGEGRNEFEAELTEGAGVELQSAGVDAAGSFDVG